MFDWEPFRLLGRSMVDYIANYYDSVEARPVGARVEPGYLKVRVNVCGESFWIMGVSLSVCDDTHKQVEGKEPQLYLGFLLTRTPCGSWIAPTKYAIIRMISYTKLSIHTIWPIGSLSSSWLNILQLQVTAGLWKNTKTFSLFVPPSRPTTLLSGAAFPSPSDRAAALRENWEHCLNCHEDTLSIKHCCRHSFVDASGRLNPDLARLGDDDAYRRWQEARICSHRRGGTPSGGLERWLPSS